ncbi:DUF2637 domain-containing protein [Streptomyces sp. NPDC056244]|uniref:DUF2637 domain-containing protein n=1 Tax=Streptomyces sp. NPDC056244 TaxID=3345762 RepID=UPI0035DCE0C3
MTHPTHVPLAVAPVGIWDRLAIVALGTAGCALSYDALQQMAVAIHVRGPLTYLFPLVIDGFIAYGVRALLVLSTAPLRARAYIWFLFGTATTASIWANALHAVRLNQQTAHTSLRLSDTVVAILSTLAPLALAGAVHLYILITRHHPTDPRRSSARTRDRTRGTTASRTSTEREQRTNSRTDQPSAAGTHSHGGADRTVAAARTRTTSDHGTAGRKQTGDPLADWGPDQADNGMDQPVPSAADQTADDLRTRIAAGDPLTAFMGPDPDTGPASMVRTAETTVAPQENRPGAHGMADDEQGQAGADHPWESAGQQSDSGGDQSGQGADQPATSRSADQGQKSSSDPSGRAAEQPGAGADQDGPGHEVPMERLVEIARDGALREGRMTRRAIRPYLRANNIKISNERFSELQSRLYEDKTLAHLPRSEKKTR